MLRTSLLVVARIALALAAAFAVGIIGLRAAAAERSEPELRLIEAAAILQAFTAEEESAIPTELLARAHGVAVIPNVIRGGFLLGGRRGRGVLVVKTASGAWSNPALITLTGGSIGWQFGAESTDLVLVFANPRSIRNIDDGKFTLGGDATAVAGPLGRNTTAALTGRAEVYAYVRSRGLFAGAAFEGARLDVDEQGNERFYRDYPGLEALGEQTPQTPQAARRFLVTLEQAAHVPAPRIDSTAPAEPEEAQIYPLGGTASP